MKVIYDFDLVSIEELLQILARNMNYSRKLLSEMSGVPLATIVKFENVHKISLESYVALCKALGYTEEIKALLGEPKYSTMQELDTINQNRNRKRGTR